MNRFFIITLTFFAMLPALTYNANAQELSDTQKAEIKKLFDAQLLESGELILQSVNAYQAELAEKDLVESSKKAEIFLKELDKKKNIPMAGNAKGDVTIVEFYDYNCGYCTKAFDEIQTVLDTDKNVKILFIDMPILSPNSVEAAKWSLAANNQGKYFEFHQAVMNHKGPKTEDLFIKTAENLKLDLDKMKKDKDSKDVSDRLENNINQARNIGVNGTPGFIIGSQLFPGFIPVEEIQKAIAQERKG